MVIMKLGLITLFLLSTLWQCGVAPPVHKNQEPDQNYELLMHYHRYLQEVVSALEKDPEFKKKIDNATQDEIKSGNIANELELVSHHVRNQLDELKRQELLRLRTLNRDQNEVNGNKIAEDPNHGHIDHSNPHTFEVADLKKLITKTMENLEEYDKTRRDSFKSYEMQKEYEKQEKLNHTNGDERAKLEKEYQEMEEKHKKHEPLHEPGHKAQFEEVWEEQDHMKEQEFDPKVFFMMHDLDSNGLWDQDEVKALFIKELNKMYDKNALEDDMVERAEEMERMRESVFKQVDTNRDGFIDYQEFLSQTKRQEYQEDHGWKGLDEEKPYTDEELEAYIREQQRLHPPQPYYPPPPGAYHAPPPGAYNPNIPPPGGHHPQGYQGNPQYQVPQGQYYNQQGDLNTNEIHHGQVYQQHPQGAYAQPPLPQGQQQIVPQNPPLSNQAPPQPPVQGQLAPAPQQPPQQQPPPSPPQQHPPQQQPPRQQPPQQQPPQQQPLQQHPPQHQQPPQQQQQQPPQVRRI